MCFVAYQHIIQYSIYCFIWLVYFSKYIDKNGRNIYCGRYVEPVSCGASGMPRPTGEAVVGAGFLYGPRYIIRRNKKRMSLRGAARRRRRGNLLLTKTNAPTFCHPERVLTSRGIFAPIYCTAGDGCVDSSARLRLGRNDKSGGWLRTQGKALQKVEFGRK